MGSSSGIYLLVFCFLNLKLTLGADKVIYKYCKHFKEIWNDMDSRAREHVSIWRAHTFESGFYPIGDTALIGYAAPNNAVILVKDVGDGLVKPPADFKKIWTDVGSGSLKNVTIYQMIPPTGYTCLGYAAVGSYYDKPNPDLYRCINSDMVTSGYLFPIWNDKGSGSKTSISFWNVENEPLKDTGILGETFIAVRGYDKPSETPYLLQYDNCSLAGMNPADNVAIVLYRTKDMDKVWDDRGAGGDIDLAIWKTKLCCSLGHSAITSYDAFTGVYAKEVKPGALAKAMAFKKVWDDADSGAYRDVTIWRPQCPRHFVALGYVATSGPVPSPEDFRCVNTDYVTPGVWAFVWDDTGTESREHVSLWQANAMNSSSQGVLAMSAVKRRGEMDSRAYVLKNDYVRVQNNKPSKKVVIYGVTYHFSDVDKLQCEPIQLSARTRAENCNAPEGSESLSVQRQLAFVTEKESSWSIESSEEFGVAVEMTAGIPDMASMAVSTSVTVSTTMGKAGRQMDQTSDSIAATINVPPGYSVEYFIIGNRCMTNIPWEGTMKTIFEDDTTHEGKVKGMFFGIEVSQITVSADAPIKCAPK